MLKKSLFVVALVAMLAGMTQAGEIKIHEWPGTWTYKAQEITSIPVKMDIGYWVNIPNQDDLVIYMEQDSIHQYSGCTSMTVQCNFDVQLSTSIAGTGAVGGDYSASLSDSVISTPGETVTVCAKLVNANLSGTTGGQTALHVANLKIKVAPYPASASDPGSTVYLE